MFYQPGKTDHGLPRDPFKACVVPRPIGWISTRSADGTDNLAPYSQFNNLTFDPPYFGSRKDTTINAETTGEFVWNLATYSLREAVNATAEEMPYGFDEFQRAGLQKEKASLVNVPMVKESPVNYHTTLRLPGNPPAGTADIVIGLVVGVHIDESVLTDGILDVAKTQPIARCGYYQYAVVRETFEMIIPGDTKLLFGLEGSVKGNTALRNQIAAEKKENGETNGEQTAR